MPSDLELAWTNTHLTVWRQGDPVEFLMPRTDDSHPALQQPH